jgi:glycosyltransferase involved in cell wall biosynthesis
MATYMENIITRHNSDIIDFHWVFPDGIGGLEWARKLGKKTVVTVRGNEAIHFFERDEVRKIIQRKLSYFDHVVTVSTDLKTKILADYSVDPSKVTVISNGIDSEKFFLMDKLEARSMCGLHTDQKYIITICRLSKEKGLDHLLKSFAKLDSQQTRLIIIGDGPLKVSLITLSETLGIADRVDFHGVIDHREACAWYNAADIFCLPSLWEGCPNVVIESLACGTPVVASNVGGIPDLISGDDYGYLVPPGDADALSSALENALNHSWNNFNISKFGSSHSWDHVAEKVIKVYERVLV